MSELYTLSYWMKLVRSNFQFLSPEGGKFAPYAHSSFGLKFCLQPVLVAEKALARISTTISYAGS